MEAGETGDRSLVMAELRRLIFTEERFLTDPDEAAAYLADERDAKKLFAVIEPGVTWDKLLPEVEALGVRMALPAAARHPYALASYQEKEILLSASRYTNKQISNLHTVLADGRTYRSFSMH
jgi:hypothetical protein